MACTGDPIFLDTQVFEEASFNFKTTKLVSLEEQVEKGNVRLILTDITVLEVKARIEKTVFEQFEGFKKFKHTGCLASGVSLDIRAVAWQISGSGKAAGRGAVRPAAARFCRQPEFVTCWRPIPGRTGGAGCFACGQSRYRSTLRTCRFR